MIIHNENPDKRMRIRAGTRFVGKENGRTFVLKDTVDIKKAVKTFDPDTGRFTGNKPASRAPTSRPSGAAGSTRRARRTTTGSWA